MEMNDILNGLNSCGDSCCDRDSDCGGFNTDTSDMNCEFGSSNGSNSGFSNCGFGNCGFGNCGFGGCGFGSWIWILLILFYGGCGRNSFLGAGGYNNNNCCCCCKYGSKGKGECCCCNKYGGNNYANGTGGCSSYLFLLVILFLCNGNFPNNGIRPFNTGVRQFNTACGFGC